MGELFILIEEEYRRAFRAERIFRDKINPLEIFNDEQLVKRYKFPRQPLLQIINMCQDDLVRPTNRNNALPVYSQVLSALSFFAKGAFQIDAGDIENISQPCVSRSISRVTNILCQHARNTIIFPSEEHVNRVKFDFYSRYRMPNTIGVIDGTLICTKGPSGRQEPLYVSRKGGHGINVQIICDFNIFIIDLIVKWPGAAHDSFIWRNSGIREQFLENPPKGWLLGDSGYPLEPWLLVPIATTTRVEEERYNFHFKKPRSKVENCISLWKSVFRCLDKSGGILQYKSEKACKIIVAAAVLHNMRRSLRLRIDDDFIAPLFPDEPPQLPLNDDAILVRGQEVRTNLINQHFT